MKIEQINASKATGITQNAGKARQTPSPDMAADFEATNRLNQVLTNTPDVRADKVARAKELLADPNYPPQELLAKISTTLANRWPTMNA